MSPECHKPDLPTESFVSSRHLNFLSLSLLKRIKDLQELRITPLDITERVPLQRKLRQGFQDRPITRRGAVFSEERKVTAILRMKAWWAAKKASEDRRQNY